MLSSRWVSPSASHRMRRKVQWPNATPWRASRICRARSRPRIASLIRWASRSSGTDLRQWRRIAWVPASAPLRFDPFGLRPAMMLLSRLHDACAPSPRRGEARREGRHVPEMKLRAPLTRLASLATLSPSGRGNNPAVIGELRHSLPVDHQLIAACAGHTYHDVARALVVGEYQVAMIRLAGDQPGAAGAAGAAFARARYVEAAGAQRLEDGGADRHLDHPAAAGEPDGKRLVVAARRGVGEGFEMHCRRRPVPGHVADRLHQAPRPAAIEVASGLLDDRPKVERAGEIAAVMVDGHLAAQCRRGEVAAKGSRIGRTGAVVELEAVAIRLQLADHGHDRRDADAAGDEDVSGAAFGERKIVDRRRDRQLGAGRDIADEAVRAPSPVRLALHGDHIAVALGGIVAQRIF